MYLVLVPEFCTCTLPSSLSCLQGNQEEKVLNAKISNLIGRRLHDFDIMGSEVRVGGREGGRWRGGRGEERRKEGVEKREGEKREGEKKKGEKREGEEREGEKREGEKGEGEKREGKKRERERKKVTGRRRKEGSSFWQVPECVCAQ